MTEGKNRRLPELEGLRAVAAIVVVVFHALLMFYPAMFYGAEAYRSVHHIHFEDNVYGQPFMGLLYGTFSVAIFFVLSGFVLSVGFFTTKNEQVIQKLAAKRYLRLMLPALASILLTWAILAFGLGAYKLHAQEVTQSDWLIGLWSFVPNFGDALWQGVIGIFQGNVEYNPVLWTMKYELIGSFIIFGSLMLFGKNKYRPVLYVLLALAFYRTWYFGFIIGMILADQYASGRFPFRATNKGLLMVALVFGVVLGGYMPGVGFYQYIHMNWLDDGQNQIFFITVGAALVVVCSLVLGWLRRIFASRFVSGLGKYTFSLYLVHKAVLFTVTAAAFTYSLHHFGFGYNKAALFAMGVSIPFVALATYLFEKYVDAPSIRLSGKFSYVVLGLPEKSADPDFSAYSETSRNILQRGCQRAKRLFR